LKAKVVSSSEEESDCGSDDPEDIGKELAMLVKKFQKFTKKKGFRKCSRSSSRNDEASTHDNKKRTCHKCKKPGHYISECPQWDNEKNKKKSKEYDSDDKKKKKSSKSSSNSSSRSSSHKKSSSGKARAFVGKEMDSEEESASKEVEVESEEESDPGVASLSLATAYVAKSIFNIEDNDLHTNAEADDKDDPAPTYCFMARGAKVKSCDAYFQTSSEDDSDCESKPSYKTLAKIATEQQKAMDTQKLLDKSDDLWDAEMTRSKSLIEDIKTC
jgi:hypothetical protein